MLVLIKIKTGGGAAARASERTMLGSNANNDSLATAEEIERVRQLCKRQFKLIMDSIGSILDQMRLVRDLEMMGEEAQVTFPMLFLKLEKLMVELNQLFEIMRQHCDN
jgi:hypothetical protein